MPANLSPCGTHGTSFAEVLESPLANSVTSCPSATSSSVSQDTTRSVPPQSLGGTASASGAIWAMRTVISFLVLVDPDELQEQKESRHQLSSHERSNKRFDSTVTENLGSTNDGRPLT